MSRCNVQGETWNLWKEIYVSRNSVNHFSNQNVVKMYVKSFLTYFFWVCHTQTDRHFTKINKSCSEHYKKCEAIKNPDTEFFFFRKQNFFVFMQKKAIINSTKNIRNKIYSINKDILIIKFIFNKTFFVSFFVKLKTLLPNSVNVKINKSMNIGI